MYKPIESYGLIGNMHSAALVATDGSIDWYCFPHFHSPSVFAAILDAEKGGLFQVSPADGVSWSRQFYWPGTNVLVSRFVDADGEAELTDFMPVSQLRHFRHCIVRFVEATRGTMRFRVKCQPRFDYGRDTHEVKVSPDGAIFSSAGHYMGLWTSAPLRADGDGVAGEFVVNEGEREIFVFGPAGDEANSQPCLTLEESQELFRHTVEFWRRWLAACSYRGRWREMVERSALVLKLLTFAPTGALIAAPTTSLPEVIGGERNWDYRYTWLRDAAFCLYALIRIGFHEESIHFMRWLDDRCHHPLPDGSLQIMYAVDGKSELEEIALTHFEGYEGSAPVRVGNAAHRQLQLDIYGELLDSVYLHNKYISPISYDLWVHLRRLADLVCERWREPDKGVWETRGEPQQFVYSKVMCWVALDRALRLAGKRSFPADVERWQRERDDIYEEVMHLGWSSSQRAFSQSYGSDALDAANLIMPLVFFMAPNDPRMLSTIDALKRPCSRGGLSSAGLVYRYDNSLSADGLTGQEGTFNMCSFWLVEALTRAGRTDRLRLEEARLLFERLLTHANHLGLYAEQTGAQGQALGNFPQAMTHLSLISAAYNLDRALDSARL
jgi:GH15 family glucan-1,4-alpha-glucosidase